MKKICFFLFIFLIGSVSAQWSQLKHPNLGGTADNEGLVNTGTSVVMATNGGILRSVNNGISWELIVTGLDTTNLSVNNIAFISSRNELWVVSAGNVFKSSDDGLTWSKVNLSELSDLDWTERLGRVNNRLVIIYAGSSGKKLAYSDNGVNWTEGAAIGTQNDWFDMVTDFNAKYLVFTNNSDNPRKFYFTTDAVNVSELPVTGLPGDLKADTEYMSIDPEGNNIFFSDRDKIYYFVPATNSWEERMTGIEEPEKFLEEVFSVHSLGVHAFASAMFMSIAEEITIKLFHSADTGKNWTPVVNPGVDFPIFEGNMITAGSGRIIGYYQNDLLAFSDNAGQTWTKITEIYGGDYDYMITLSDGSVLAVSPDEMKGIIKSSDNGNTWTLHNGDLPDFMGIHLIDAIWPGGPDANYCTTAEDPFSEKPYLFKTTNGGENWTKITTAPDSAVIKFVGRHGNSNPIVFFGNTDWNGTYQYSITKGASWVNLTPAINALAVDRVLGIKGNGVLMILFAQKDDRTRVYKSIDQGASFTDITSNLDNPQTEILVADKNDWRRPPSAIASFSGDGTLFILAAMDWSVIPSRISFFILNGTQDGWNKADGSGLQVPNYIDCHALKFIQGVWYFVSPIGVFASINNCVSWQRVWNNEGFVKGLHPRSFVANGYALFLGTQDAGLWRTLISAPIITTKEITEITGNSAKSGGTIISTGGLPFGGKGICWNTETGPTTGNNVLFAGNSWESYTAVMSSLSPATQYFVRAFVQSPRGLVYGDEITFTTENTTGIVAGNCYGTKLYPNPCDGRFNVMSNSEMSMTIMNIIGKVVLSAPVYSGINTFELPEQPAGIYFVKFTGKDVTEKTVRLIIR